MTTPEQLVRPLPVGERVGTYSGPGIVVAREEDSFYGSNSHGCIQRGMGAFERMVSTAHDPYRYDVLLDRDLERARTDVQHRWSPVEHFDRSRLDPLADTVFAKNARTVHYLLRIRRYYDGIDESGADYAWTDDPAEWHVELMEPDDIDRGGGLTHVDLAATWFQENGGPWEPSVSPGPPNAKHDWLSTRLPLSSRWPYEESVYLKGFTGAEAAEVWKRALR